MGLARDIDRILLRELGCHAAWPPLSTSIELGDYGSISDGVFVPMGNVARDAGAEIGPTTDSPGAALDFVSAAANVTRVSGSVSVASFGESEVAAQLSLRLHAARALVLRAKHVHTRTLVDVARIASGLASRSSWRRGWWVVRRVWSCRNALLLSTIQADTEITFRGLAPVLRALEMGDADGGVTVASDKPIGLQMVGRGGVLGIELFRLGPLGGVRTRDVDAIEVEYADAPGLDDEM